MVNSTTLSSTSPSTTYGDPYRLNTNGTQGDSSGPPDDAFVRVRATLLTLMDQGLEQSDHYASCITHLKQSSDPIDALVVIVASDQRSNTCSCVASELRSNRHSSRSKHRSKTRSSRSKHSKARSNTTTTQSAIESISTTSPSVPVTPSIPTVVAPVTPVQNIVSPPVQSIPAIVQPNLIQHSSTVVVQVPPAAVPHNGIFQQSTFDRIADNYERVIHQLIESLIQGTITDFQYWSDLHAPIQLLLQHAISARTTPAQRMSLFWHAIDLTIEPFVDMNVNVAGTYYEVAQFIFDDEPLLDSTSTTDPSFVEPTNSIDDDSLLDSTSATDTSFVEPTTSIEDTRLINCNIVDPIAPVGASVTTSCDTISSIFDQRDPIADAPQVNNSAPVIVRSCGTLAPDLASVNSSRDNISSVFTPRASDDDAPLVNVSSPVIKAGCGALAPVAAVRIFDDIISSFIAQLDSVDDAPPVQYQFSDFVKDEVSSFSQHYDTITNVVQVPYDFAVSDYDDVSSLIGQSGPPQEFQLPIDEAHSIRMDSFSNTTCNYILWLSTAIKMGLHDTILQMYHVLLFDDINLQNKSPTAITFVIMSSWFCNLMICSIFEIGFQYAMSTSSNI
mmetsp:Transcript_19780/g.22431  ORF Transcript_19780/g.22431 Transcript_19780/m.22431 type:complete len:615 (+) Transcript_19780:316-2160(+)